jgi:hypothetical protein
LVFTPEALAAHAGDKWFASHLPEAVALPASVESVSRILAFASKHQIPVTPRGAGHGYVGGCVPVHGGIALSVAGMNRVLEISAADFVAVVQPGVVTASLQEADLERLAGDSFGPAVGATPGAVAAGHRYRGRVFGSLEVSGSRAGAHSLVGRGQLRLRDADIYELPVVVALLKVLRVKAPDRNAFSSSLVDFRIEGPHAYLDNIELAGDAISLVGNGEIDFDSNVHMTFRSIMGDAQTQLPVMKRVLGGASGQFMLIHVDGTLASPEMSSEAFPTLSAALQKLQSQRRNPEGQRTATARRDVQFGGQR